MTKYQQYFQEMLRENENIFKSFKVTHDKYVEKPQEWQSQFNSSGKEILNVIRIWESKLCQKSESGQYGKFSSKLSEKFWEVIRNYFPKIDFVGVKIS